MSIVKDLKFFSQYTDADTFSKLSKNTDVVSFLKKIEANYKDLFAVREDGIDITYEMLCNDVKSIIGKINTLGLDKKSNIGLIANNDYNFVKTSLAIMASGNVAVLLPNALDEKTIYGCCLKYELKAFFFEEPFDEKVTFARNVLKTINFVKIEKFDNLGSFATVEAKDAACIVMTGGTTGRSKGAILSHEALMTGTFNGSLGVKYPLNQVYYSIMPLTHVFGLIRNLFSCLDTGSTMYFCKSKQNMFAEIQAARPTTIIVVPALGELFLNLVKKFGIGFLGGRVHTMICGAASVPPYLIVEYKKLGIEFLPGYGLTELANLVTGNPDGIKNPTSVGYFYPDQEIKIVNGELWIKGPNLMIGYYNEPEENKNSFEDGWFKTGDLIRVDESGYVYIEGRIKNIIVLENGENVSPSVIEDKINQLDYIQDSLVTYVKNELGVKVLQVEVVLRQSVLQALNIQTSLLEFVTNGIEEVNKTLLDYERIEKVVIRDKDFERSPSMKIIRPKQEI